MTEHPQPPTPEPTQQQLLVRLARCHALLQDAEANLDPEAYPDLCTAIGKELGGEEPDGHCGIPGCALTVCSVCALTSDAVPCPRCAAGWQPIDTAPTSDPLLTPAQWAYIEQAMLERISRPDDYEYFDRVALTIAKTIHDFREQLVAEEGRAQRPEPDKEPQP